MAAAKTVLITGATGMVGRQVLDLLLAHGDVSAVRSIGRRPSGISDDKLHEIVHENFLEFSSVRGAFENVDLCVYCLGVYQSQVSKERFYEITCDCQQAFTECLVAVSPQADFVLFSAQGADSSGRNWATFARAKGRAETLLSATAFANKYIFRPGYIIPTGDRRPNGVAYRLLAAVVSALRRLGFDIGISDRDLANAMVMTGIEADSRSGIFEQSDIKGVCRSQQQIDLSTDPIETD